MITSTDANSELPTEFVVQGNYPNPFNPSTQIEIDLPESAQVTVEIIDLLGRKVMTLPAQEMEAGAKRTIEVNAANLASGNVSVSCDSTVRLRTDCGYGTDDAHQVAFFYFSSKDCASRHLTGVGAFFVLLLVLLPTADVLFTGTDPELLLPCSAGYTCVHLGIQGKHCLHVAGERSALARNERP